MHRDVEITGHLEIALEDRGIVDVTAHGSRIRAEIGDFTLARPGLRLVRSSALLARRLARVLAARALTLAVTRRGEPLVELGAGVEAHPLARLIGWARVRVHRRT